jgi:metal-responsive CopG/Arc/MetJ family transcriptional regulator
MPKVITFIAPDEMVSEIDEAVKRLDTDQSKLVRLAVREKLSSIKSSLPPTAAAALAAYPPSGE